MWKKTWKSANGGKNLLVPKRLPHKRGTNHVIFVIVCVFRDSNPNPQVSWIPFPPLVNVDYTKVYTPSVLIYKLFDFFDTKFDWFVLFKIFAKF